MSSTLRLSIIMVLLLATTALGLIAYNMNRSPEKVPVVQVTEKAPAPLPVVKYLVAARQLPRGTLAREEDFAVRSAPSDSVPTGDTETPDARRIRGSLQFLDTDSPVTLPDLLRREIRVSSPASWHRIAVPSASRLTRSLASRA
jgi:pilus assembly protein CpaB